MFSVFSEIVLYLGLNILCFSSCCLSLGKNPSEYIYKLRLCVLRHESFMKTNLDYNYQFTGYRLVAT